MQIKLDAEYITLTQCLKLANIIDTGGQVKWFLQENSVYVNGSIESRRGRKLYSGDIVRIGDTVVQIKADS